MAIVRINQHAVAEFNEELKLLDFSALLLQDKETEQEFMVQRTMDRPDDMVPFHCEHGFRDAREQSVLVSEACSSPATWVIAQSSPGQQPFFGCAFHFLHELGPDGHYSVVAGEVLIRANVEDPHAGHNVVPTDGKFTLADRWCMDCDAPA